MKEKRLIIGLGNPDPLLEDTYHNIGVAALRSLILRAEKAGTGSTELRFKNYKDLFSYAKSDETVFIKPLVYMNDSGRMARAASRFFEVAPKHIIVIHDDSDIATGEVKFSAGQSAAGHRGVQSIIDALGSQDFQRVRIGIRNKNEKRRKKASEFVLKSVKVADRKIFKDVFEKIALHLDGEGH